MAADLLAGFQAAFVQELLQPQEALPGSRFAAQPGFAVYRNTVMAGCIDALTANYPTVHQLIGTDAFGDAARAFARSSPPRSGVLADYGAGFAFFLASFDTVADLDYLPGVAALDRCWTEAHLAASAPVLQAADLARLTPERLGRARLVPHPAARWQAFETMPVYTIWRRHREGLPLDDELDWHGEAALLTRPAGSVSWTGLTPDMAVFLTSCASGRSFAEAMDDAAPAGSPEDASTWLPRLLHAGAFREVVEAGRG